MQTFLSISRSSLGQVSGWRSDCYILQPGRCESNIYVCMYVCTRTRTRFTSSSVTSLGLVSCLAHLPAALPSVSITSTAAPSATYSTLTMSTGCQIDNATVYGTALPDTYTVSFTVTDGGLGPFAPASFGIVNANSLTTSFTLTVLPCPTCATGYYNSSVCQQTAVGGGVTCNACTTCTPGSQYTSRVCSATRGTDAVCSACTTCGAGSYTVRACGGAPGSLGHDAVCRTCTACGPLAYKTGGCTGTLDTVCAPCSGCNANGTASCTGAATCACKSGFAGATCSACAPGMYGPQCDQTCACNATGTAACVRGTGACVCNSGFGGTLCERCASTTAYGPACTLTCSCSLLHGTCHAGPLGDGTCKCNDGWQGPTCGVPVVTGTVVYPGAPLPVLVATSGTPFYYAIPTSAFVMAGPASVLVITGVAVGVPATACTGGDASAPASAATWLSVVGDGGSPSGYALTGTPGRDDVTLSPPRSRSPCAGGAMMTLRATLPSTATADLSISVNVVHGDESPLLAVPWGALTVPVGASWTGTIAFNLSSATAPPRGTAVGGYWDADVADGYNDTVNVLLTLGDGSPAPAWISLTVSSTVSSNSISGSGSSGGGFTTTFSVSARPPLSAAGTNTTLLLIAVDASSESTSTAFAIAVPANVGATAALAWAGAVIVPATAGAPMQYVVTPSTLRIGPEPGQLATVSDAGVTVPPLASLSAAVLDCPTWLTASSATLHAVPRPELLGTPPLDGGSTNCTVTVTAVNAVGFAVTTNVTVMVSTPATPPALAITAPSPLLIVKALNEYWEARVDQSAWFVFDTSVSAGGAAIPVTVSAADISIMTPAVARALLAWSCVGLASNCTLVAPDSTTPVSALASNNASSTPSAAGTAFMLLISAGTPTSAVVPVTLALLPRGVFRVASTPWR